MNILETIKVFAKEQKRHLANKNIKSNHKEIIDLCSATTIDELSTLKDFSGEISFYHNSKFFPAIKKISCTQLFMGNPDNFNYLMKENPYFNEAFNQQAFLAESNSDFFHPIDIPTIAKNRLKLFKILLETKTQFKYNFYADTDDMFKTIALWKKTGINHLQTLVEANGGTYKGDKLSILETNYLEKSKVQEYNSSFTICDHIEKLVHFGIDKKFEGITEGSSAFVLQAKKTIPDIKLFKKLAGDNYFTQLTEYNGSHFIERTSILDVIDKAMQKYPSLVEHCNAIERKNLISKNMDKILRQQEAKNKINPIITPDDEDFGLGYKI